MNGEARNPTSPSRTLTTTFYYFLMLGVQYLYKSLFSRIFRSKSSLKFPVEEVWVSLCSNPLTLVPPLLHTASPSSHCILGQHLSELESCPACQRDLDLGVRSAEASPGDSSGDSNVHSQFSSIHGSPETETL